MNRSLTVMKHEVEFRSPGIVAELEPSLRVQWLRFLF